MGSPQSGEQPASLEKNVSKSAAEKECTEVAVAPVEASEAKDATGDSVNASESHAVPAPDASPPDSLAGCNRDGSDAVAKRPRPDTPVVKGESEATGEAARAEGVENVDDDDPFAKAQPSRRANRRKRQRSRPPPADGSDSEGETQDELALLREAQRLRAASRRGALPQRAPSKPDASAETAASGGLQAQFRAERGGRAGEARMEAYVSAGLESRFGVDATASPAGPVDAAAAFAAQLYAVPAHLRAAPAPAYDPGAGLPAAGVEEVDLPGAAERNEEATGRARKKIGRGRGTTAKVAGVSANVAADFARHRQEWIDERKEVAMAEGEGEKTEKHPRRGRRVEMASDAAAVERFRKRWRH